ncbi:MAG: hypothetical protein QOE24_2313 [Frankiales bacterium]|nr:hypothetical protein [Frankiales bacterium]
MTAVPPRPAPLLLSVLAVTAGVLAPSPSLAASAPAVAPSMVLTTAGSPHWYSKAITAAHSSSPAIAKLGPHQALEVVDGFPDGTVQGWSTSGKHLWTFRTGAGAVQASPVVVDLNRDGHLDVVTANTAGNVWAFTPSLHNKVIFHKNTGDGVHSPGDFATPAVADINRDGKLDIVETSWDHHIHVWSGKGSHQELPGFPVFLKDTSWSSPAVADVDGDGWPEIAFGFDCAGVPGQPCHPHPGGYVGVLRHNGAWEPGWPRFVPQVVWSTPAIVDLLGNGKREIVVGTGSMPSSSAKKLLAFTAHGTPVKGFPSPQSAEISSSPAIGDVDGDGKKDIVYTTNDGVLRVANRAGKVTASSCLAGSWHTCPIGYRPNVALADVNNDGQVDILVGNEVSVGVYDKVGSSLRRIRVLDTYGHNAGGFAAAPTVAQVGNVTWVVAGTTKPGSLNVGQVFVWKFDNRLGRAPWPTFKRAASRPGHG